MSEGGRERERDRNREGGCWVREMGGAALLRNAKHRISSIVKKTTETQTNYGSGEEKKGRKKREGQGEV